MLEMRPNTPRRKILATSVLCLALVAGCGHNDDRSEGDVDGSDTLGNIVVYGAASLSAVLPAIMDATVLAEFPETEISYNFAGSSSLIDELSAGAPADVVFTADEVNMEKALDKELVATPEVFTSNTLVLVTPEGNPAGITSFSTDALANTRLVVCATQVPCGHSTRVLSSLDGVELNPVSEEQSVSDVLDKVVNGEADAGIVYKTDAQLKADNLKIIQIPNANQVVNNYMVALTTSAQNRQGATAVIDAVNSSTGKQILGEYGFSFENDRPDS